MNDQGPARCSGEGRLDRIGQGCAYRSTLGTRPIHRVSEKGLIVREPPFGIHRADRARHVQNAPASELVGDEGRMPGRLPGMVAVVPASGQQRTQPAPRVGDLHGHVAPPYRESEPLTQPVGHRVRALYNRIPRAPTLALCPKRLAVTRTQDLTDAEVPAWFALLVEHGGHPGRDQPAARVNKGGDSGTLLLAHGRGVGQHQNAVSGQGLWRYVPIQQHVRLQVGMPGQRKGP